MSSVRMRISMFGAATCVAALTVAGLSAPASAHEAPKAGTTCAMSGTTEVVHGTVYVCVNLKNGQKPRWNTGQKITTTALTMTDPWAKASKKGTMSAAFGTLKNPTNKPIRVVAAISSASEVLQLHEIAMKGDQMVMQQKNGGFLIPAGGSLELKPGGNHIMFMDLTKALTAGRTVPVTLVTADGGLLTVKPLVKVYNGGNESYDDTSAGSSMSGMSGM